MSKASNVFERASLGIMVMLLIYDLSDQSLSHENNIPTCIIALMTLHIDPPC